MTKTKNAPQRSAVHAAAPVQAIRLTGGAGSVDVVEAAATNGKPALAKYKMVVYTGRDMVVGGYGRVVIDLAGLRIPSGDMPAYRDHNSAKVVGHGRVGIEGGQVVAAGLVSGTGPDAQEVLANARNGFPWQSSIGLMPARVETVAAGKSVTVNDKIFSGPISVIRAGDMYEHSFVPLGADGNSSAEIAARRAAENGGDHMLETTTTGPATVAAPAAAPVAAAAQPPAVSEEARQALIHQEFAGFHVDPVAARRLEAQAINEGWDIDKTRLALLYAERPKAPAIMVHGASADVPNKVILTAALCRNLKGDCFVENAFSAPVAQAVRERGPANLLDLCAAIVIENGGTPERHPNSLLRQTLSIRGGFSTVSLPNILSDTATKMLVDSLASVPSFWRQFADVRSVQNFKETTGYRGLFYGILQKLAGDGEIKHGNISEEEVCSYHVDTFGLQFGITRKQIIDDDLGVFAKTAEGLGRMANRKINDLVASTMLDGVGSGHFAAGRGNYKTTASALSAGALTAAVTAFVKQVDSAGNILDLRPSYLLIPPELQNTAATLLQAETIASTSNVLRDLGLKIIVEPRLSLDGFHSLSSESLWFLLGPTNTSPVIVAFLRGMEAPTIETIEQPADVLGVGFRCYWDFGAALGEFRAAVLNTGESGS
jgi:hypothetical protein